MSLLLPLGLVLLVVLAFWKVVDEEREAPPTTPPTGPWDAYGVPGDEHGYDTARAWEIRVAAACRGFCAQPTCKCFAPCAVSIPHDRWGTRPVEPPVEADEDELELRSMRR